MKQPLKIVPWKLPGHDGKVAADKKMIFISHQRHKVEIEIIAAIFLWFLKQQLNFQLFLEDWYWEKWELKDLPGHVGKVTAEKKWFHSH